MLRASWICAVLAALLWLPAGSWGASPDLVLTVPPSLATLHLAVDLPQSSRVLTAGPGQLAEIGAPAAPIPVQGVPLPAGDGSVLNKSNRLVADIPPRAGATAPRRVRLEPAAASGAPQFRFVDLDEKSLKLFEGDKPVLVYNHGTITCPKVPAKDPRRSRACYVHPLWGLGGEVLTDDFPADHYHHHGIFWTWPHVGIDGEQYDLWADSGIAQRFVRWLDCEAGPVAAVLGVENGWFVGEKKVMVERVWLRVYRATKDERSIDLDFTWIPTDRAVTLRGAEEKSYGGLTVRFAVGKPAESVITVPGGPAKDDLPDTRLPWADLTAKFAGAARPSGAALFVPREHPDYPPTWLTRHYGAMCIGWPGVHGKTFPAGQPIRLSYRLWIHPSTAGTGQLEAAYAAYLTSTAVRWEP
ncbi:MAG: DUF6807 family protein [Thermoguttaceae bacterium]|jgi:hypothetical protein